jgi:hypothetical protein
MVERLDLSFPTPEERFLIAQSSSPPGLDGETSQSGLGQVSGDFAVFFGETLSSIMRSMDRGVRS